MRKLLLILLVVSGGATLSTTPAVAAADTSTTSVRVPLNTVFGNSCQAEPVAVTGVIHVAQHTTTDVTGGIHIVNVVNFQGVEGTGLLSGFRYRLSSTQIEFVSNFTGNGAQEETEIAVGQFVATGRGSDLATHANIHFTINANGDLAVLFANQTQECR